MHLLRRFVCGLPLLATALVAACSDNRSTSPKPFAATRSRPSVSDVAVASNPYNVLSAVVTFSAPDADSVRVISQAVGDSLATPFFPISGATGRIVVLGLLPNTKYVHTVQVFGDLGVTAKASVKSTTADLPSYVKRATLTAQGVASPGYLLVSPIVYTADTGLLLAFDSRSRIRWYREFPGQQTDEFKMQPNGHFTAYLAPAGGFSAGPTTGAYFLEMLPSGDSVGAYTPPPPFGADVHELWLTGSPGPIQAHLFGVTTAFLDLTPVGGPPDTGTLVHSLFRQSTTGTVAFQWNSLDRYSIADWIEPTGLASDDYDHPNSLNFDLDGNYIASFRAFGAVLKIDANTGNVLWQFGGRQNQFQILNDPVGGFSGQHCAIILSDGHLLVYDNGLRHVPQVSRAVEYALDLNAMTATMVWQYSPKPPVFTPIVGSVQRLQNGHTLVGFGFAGQVDEVDQHATRVWTGKFNLNGSAPFYRVHRIVSLYAFGDS